MKDLTSYSDNALSLEVFNDEYFYIERNHFEFLVALVNEEFIYTPEQMAVLCHDLGVHLRNGSTT